MKKLGLISDLHLEHSMFELDNPGWDYLVIAGDLSTDINKMQLFLEKNAPKNIPIIYVFGNHEYEGRSIDSVYDLYKEGLKDFENVHILDNSTIVFDDIKFIGTTLWTNFELDGLDKKQEHMKWAKQFTDIKCMYVKNKHDGKYYSMTPEDVLQLNEKAYKFLNYELRNSPFQGTKIVVSHFAPHKNSIHENFKNKMNSYWVNHYEELMGFSDYWFHGHTHNSYNYIEEGTNVICNPRGVSKQFNLHGNRDFNKDFIVEVN
jgi:predicted phosphodiesterase